ncbi:hypothetical protein DFH11DRAFT_453106 [Phellopilus nigrolimitatus]|nr:hypothetical protein DFH11DRAFT_453106 [Phellopilus nigrolimitatus]
MTDNRIMQRKPSVFERVPPEIIKKIFLACLFSRPHITPAKRQAPLNVSETCRYWRNIALSTTQLWAHLDFYSEEDPIQYIHLQYLLTTMHTWFARSNNAPLSSNMHISIRDDSDRALCSTAEQVVSSLFRQQNRWKAIKLYCTGWEFSEDFYLAATSMPLIESLQLHCPRRRYYHPRFDGVLDLTSSLGLKTLNCDGAFVLNQSSASLMALTHCVFTYKSPFLFMDVCLNLLQIAPNLQVFIATFLDTNFEPAVPPCPMLVLPRLRMLWLAKGVTPSMLLEKLTLPGLVDLRIQCAHGRADEVLVDFMQRSQPPLRRLEISGGCPEDGVLLNVLHMLPALRSLTIKTAILSNYFLIGMTIGNPWGAPCQALEEIMFHDVLGWKRFETMVGDMLVSRWRGQGGLKRVGLSLVECDLGQVWRMEAVRRCMKEGLQVRVKLRN